MTDPKEIAFETTAVTATKDEGVARIFTAPVDGRYLFSNGKIYLLKEGESLPKDAE